MKEEWKKFAILIASVLVVSGGVSAAVSFANTSIRESAEKLTVVIRSDKTPFGVEPLILNLSARVINAKGKVSYKWDFGNGETSTEKEVTVVYDEPGEYECTLVVTDESGRKGEDHIKVIVKENRPPIVTLTINKKTVDRKFTWLNLLSMLPIPFNPLAWAGNQQLILDSIEETWGPWAWGESGIVITAQINDPEGDKIVSYEWKVQTADKLVTMTGKTFLPVHNLTGEDTVKIPALYAWIPVRYIVTLTVKDSAGNIATATTDYMVSQNQIETTINSAKLLIVLLPTILSSVKDVGNVALKALLSHAGKTFFTDERIENISIFLDNIYNKIDTGEGWWNYTPDYIRSILKMVIGRLPSMIGIPYEPPVDKANLSVSEVKSFNFSAYVNPCGLVTENVTLERTFNITNIDTNLTAYEILLSLDKPYSEKKGLPLELEKDGVTVKVGVNSYYRNLFHHGAYTDWKDGMMIKSLSPGDTVECKLMIRLEKGTTLEKGIYNCYLYAYQNKTLSHEELVDVIPFKVII